MINNLDLHQLSLDIKRWGKELGFQKVGITDTHLGHAELGLNEWLSKGYNATMEWMGAHGTKRSRPEELLPGTLRVISVRMDYLPPNTEPISILKDGNKGYISRYALGRDYHKLIRKRLSLLADKIDAALPQDFPRTGQHRPFVDSAPVMERPLADKAGLGWTGKHTLLLDAKTGSWFFLGEIYSFLPLPIDDSPQANQCGECTACLKVCPTDAFVAPYILDANRCISYLTIEHKGSIPEEFREVIGNRIYGCDDCQLICPWNKFAPHTQELDFLPRHQLDQMPLEELFLWDEATFLRNTEGSPIRRIGYELWQRNLAIALGNAPQSASIIALLNSAKSTASPLVQEHIEWAIEQQQKVNHRRKRKLRRNDPI